MKHLFLPLLGFLICLTIQAQEPDSTKKSNEFQFTTVKALPITSVKNQSSSGTCWSFSMIGFIEAELLRQGKGEHDLSEMFVVHKNYEDKARKYVRMMGKINFAAGGSFDDVLACIKEYGIVPDEIQTGLYYGEEKHRHGEMDRILEKTMDVVVSNPNKKLSTAWYNAVVGILDAYLGKCPEQFTYQGKTYTPQTYAQSLGLNWDDYVSITSFTHHPFYTAFPLEIPDNWRWSSSFNVP
ncbi:MAG: aminopeptidase, partial [Dysgonamonadaceae bacterium]|nr:aminopeptidase [Dysgonamonadaceae bacterium]